MRDGGVDGSSGATSPRVLLVSQPTAAGTARHVADLAEGLSARGLGVTVACPSSGVLPDRLRAAGVPVVPLAMRRDISPLSDLVSFVRLYRMCRRLRPDVLHAHSSKAGFLGRLAGRLAGVPVVEFTPHCWSFQSATGTRRAMYVALERFASRFCDMTITVSAKEAREAVDLDVVSEDRVRVIPNGVGESDFVLDRDPTGDLFFVSVGRLDEQKGYADLLDAMAELNRTGRAARLSIIGDGALRTDLEARVTRLGLGGLVTFEGEQADVRPFLGRAQVFVLSSLWEGLPYTIIEAMAARLPVVCTDVGGCRELVEDGVTGYVVPAGDTEALARAMAALAWDADLRRRMGEAGQHRARESFRVESCVDENAQVYAECLEAAWQRKADRRRQSLLGPRAAVVLTIIAVLALGAVAAVESAMGDRIAPGVRIGAADVGGMTVDDAARRLSGSASRPMTVSVSATAPGIPVDGAGLDLAVIPAVRRAYLVGRAGDLPARIGERTAAARGEIRVPLAPRPGGSLAALVSDVRRACERAPVDAAFALVGDELQVTPDRAGVTVDESALLDRLGTAATADRTADRTAVIPLRTAPAAVTDAQARAVLAQARQWTRTGLVGSVSGSRLGLSRGTLASLLVVRRGGLAVSEDRLAEVLAGARLPSSEPRDARFVVSGGVVRIVDGASGSQVDASGTARAIERALGSGGRTFAIAVRQRWPEVTSGDLARLHIDTQLSSYTTHFRLGQDGRDINISLAAAAIRGRVLGAGEVFSLNAETGPRNRKTGYQESLIFSNGKVVPGVGGGVCQVSSTTYQAALRAGMRIVDRQSHSMVVSYMPPGMDATTFYPIVDLKFQNTAGAPVLVWTSVSGNTLTVSIYGSTEKPDIAIETAIRQTIRPGTRTVYGAGMRQGVKVVEAAGVPGYVVDSYRLFYKNGRVAKRELLATDEYRPRNRVVVIGN